MATVSSEPPASCLSHLPKDYTLPMAAAYEPKLVESEWSEWWEKQGYFTPAADETSKLTAEDRKFVMVIPPPNVTGSLHLGHTLTVAVEDTLARWHRMKGDLTLWVVGVDHAGIATQSVVERQLYKIEGKSRHDLGREQFLKRVWDWKNVNGDRICYQFRRLGVSVDWSRECFTMDAKLCRAVTEAFVRLFDSGLIYRDTRLVSWCPHLKTALSDVEVDTEDIEGPTRTRIPGFDKTVEVGMLWVFKYKVFMENGAERYLEVATTRIETMLGDVAVAVNPKDKRYTDIVGCRLIHPFFPERDMRVVADDHVDIEFGTGAVKITPAHDRNDYELGKRHKLPIIHVFTLDGKISESGGPLFAGMHRFECRIQIEKKLDALGLMVEKKPNEKKMQLPRCSRSNDIVEYMLIPQWWMNCDKMAADAAAAVRNDELKLIPAMHKQTWFYWLDNIKDWCISRQLWWGHRIPAYRVVLSGPTTDPTKDDVWVAARSLEEARQRAEKITGRTDFELQQDEDVLDTWFSSGLFPFSTLGWPEETDDLKSFFPTTLLETGHDILFFWVARMVMLSQQLLGRLPFSTVYLHAMVRDSHGKKMSKSLGNVIDPIEAIEGITLQEMHDNLSNGLLPEKEVARARDAQKKDFPKGIPECGADALRYGLLAYTKQGRNINLDTNRVVGYRNFCNKLWNATKFSLINFPPGFRVEGLGRRGLALTWADRWILHRLSECAKLTNQSLQDYQFSDAVSYTYSFWLYELCDVYLELLKPRLASPSTNKEQKDPTACSDKSTSTPEAAVVTDTQATVGSRLLTPDALTALEVLNVCLDRGLRSLHPMIPFVTEELYHRLPESCNKAKSICMATYPTEIFAWHDAKLDVQHATFMSIVKQFRSLLAQLEVNPKDKLNGLIRIKSTTIKPVVEVVGSTTNGIARGASVIGTEDAVGTSGLKNSTLEGEELHAFVCARAKDVSNLAKLKDVAVLPFEVAASPSADVPQLPKGSVVDIVNERIEIVLCTEGTVNLAATLAKIEKKLAANQKSAEGYIKKIENPQYLTKVPEEVRMQTQEKLLQLQEERKALQFACKSVESAIGNDGS